MTDHVFTPNPLYVDVSNPSQLDEHIYLAGCATARQHELLREIGVTAVCNLTPDDYGCADAGFDVFRVPIDDATEINESVVGKFLAQMDKWEAEGAVVLIHCHAGISRTSAFTIAWLMHKRGANARSDLRTMWSQCEDAVSVVRPIIMPHYLLKRAVIEHFEKAA